MTECRTFRTLFATLGVASLALTGGAQAQDRTVPRSATELKLSFAPVVKRATPSVVNVYAARAVEVRNPLFDDPLFRRFFGAPGNIPREQMQRSLGSGVIVSADGIVVSNYHVVGRATEIRVVLNDRREYAADLILGDEESDLAILRLQDATDLPALALRNSDEVEVGDLVLAIGNPFGVGQTVSSGIVSGLARSSVELGRGYFIQTDAAINPGNSGGALVDMQGRLVGINTAILTRSGGSNGIGFAIPANLVQTVVAQALAGNTRFARPWAGVQGQAMDASLAAAMNLVRPDGVLLLDLHPDSPFAKAGLRAGDVVLSVAGEPTNTAQEMIFRLAALGIGATVPVTYLQDDRTVSVDVTLIAPPETPARDPVTITDAVALQGLSVSQINPAVMSEIGLLSEDSAGVVVTAAQDLAARVGLRVGDVVLAINGRAIASTQDVAGAAGEQTRLWTIDLNRGGQMVRLRFRL